MQVAYLGSGVLLQKSLFDCTALVIRLDQNSLHFVFRLLNKRLGAMILLCSRLFRSM